MVKVPTPCQDKLNRRSKGGAFNNAKVIKLVLLGTDQKLYSMCEEGVISRPKQRKALVYYQRRSHPLRCVGWR